MKTESNMYFGRRALAVVLATAALLAGSAVYGALVTSGGSKILFTAKQAEVPVDGEFKKFTADLEFDLAKPAAGKVNLTIDLGSVTTGSGDADQLLKSKEFFSVGQYPQATFVSQAISQTAAGRFQAKGQFTLKGRSMALVVPFSARPEGTGLRLEGSVPVSRLAFKVGEGEWSDTGTLADAVQIRFNLFLPR